MVGCLKESESCINCSHHFQRLRPLVGDIVISKRFVRDAPDFDVDIVLSCRDLYSNKLHKFEGSINGVHIFRALVDGLHLVYAIDGDHRLIFLRAFSNFSAYGRYLGKKKKILADVKSTNGTN